jgi:hypothetical protein
MSTRSIVVGLLLAGAAAASVPDTAAHRAEIEAWRAGRVERLQKPDGWLSLVGLHWLAPGKQSVGSAADKDIVLAVGPAHLGTIELDAGKVTLTLAPDAQATIGDGAARSAELKPDVSRAATVVHMGEANFIVIERSGRYGLRVKDPQAQTRTHFLGFDYFDIAPEWRVEARFEPHEAGRKIPIATAINTIEPSDNPGAIVFEKNGKTFRLEAVDEGDGQLFVIFADRTSGRQTYGAGRFVYADPPAPGSDHVVLDFNKAYNPPCVFTPYATCPLPPPENRLNLAVTAGEKKYRGANH